MTDQPISEQNLTILTARQGKYEAKLRRKCEEYQVWAKRRSEVATGSSEWEQVNLKLAEFDDQFSKQAKERMEEEAELLREIEGQRAIV